MKNKEIEELLNELKWYVDAPNEQDYNGEYDPPLEWEQGEVKLLLSYIEQLKKENERLQQENQQLKKQKDDVVELIKKTPFLYSPFKQEVLRMLGEGNV